MHYICHRKIPESHQTATGCIHLDAYHHVPSDQGTGRPHTFKKLDTAQHLSVNHVSYTTEAGGLPPKAFSTAFLTFWSKPMLLQLASLVQIFSKHIHLEIRVGLHLQSLSLYMSFLPHLAPHTVHSAYMTSSFRGATAPSHSPACQQTSVLLLILPTSARALSVLSSASFTSQISAVPSMFARELIVGSFSTLSEASTNSP